MRQLALLLIPLALLACTPAPSTGDDDNEPSGWDYAIDPDVDTYLPADYRADDPQRVIFLGDSITAGAGASANDLDYPSLLVENDNQEWAGWNDYDLRSLFGLSEVVDVSQGGATTGSLVNSQLPDLSGRIDDVVSGQSIVVITIGGNDMQSAIFPLLISGDREAEYQRFIDPVIDNMVELLDYFGDDTRFPDGVFVYMTNVYEPTDAVGQTSACFLNTDLSPVLEYFDRANAELRAVAEERAIGWVDLRGHFLGHGHNHDDESGPGYEAEDPSLWFSSDCIHPNDRGHHELRRLFYTAIDGRPLEAQSEVP